MALQAESDGGDAMFAAAAPEEQLVWQAVRTVVE
jgi:hypothetical protein